MSYSTFSEQGAGPQGAQHLISSKRMPPENALLFTN